MNGQLHVSAALPPLLTAMAAGWAPEHGGEDRNSCPYRKSFLMLAKKISKLTCHFLLQGAAEKRAIIKIIIN
jgi:hypothetical protein